MPDSEEIQDILKFKNQLISGTKFDFDTAVSFMFQYQSKHNPVYRQYLELLKFSDKDPAPDKIPFLPIRLFKSFEIKTMEWTSQTIFHSSSTTGKGRSAHHLRDINWYDAISKNIFERHFGDIKGKLILALLPGYLERQDSSLVHMVDRFIKVSAHSGNGFYLDQYDALLETISRHEQEEIILFGVPYALIKCLEVTGKQHWSNVTLIETGGMKGKGREMPRNELHSILEAGFAPRSIYSEYGMTELLSQAYTNSTGRFQAPTSMHIQVRELNDPFQNQKKGKPGTLNIIDLANIDSCCFIETEDMAIDHGDGTFEILGRIDNREIRGCNLLAL